MTLALVGRSLGSKPNTVTGPKFVDQEHVLGGAPTWTWRWSSKASR